MPEPLPADSSLSREEDPDGKELTTRQAPIGRSRLLRGFVVVGLVAFWTMFFLMGQRGAKETAAKTRAIQNLAGPIKSALLAYAEDHQEHFPDAPLPGGPSSQSSNQAFRRLFVGGYLNDETLFSVPYGAAQADGDLSSPERVLSKGENHYALAKGLLGTSNASLPLVWEAPLTGHWNPTWDSSRNRAEWGSTWSDGSVLVMTVGGSVTTMKIDRPSPDQKGPGRLAPTEEGKNLFQLHPNVDSLGPEW